MLNPLTHTLSVLPGTLIPITTPVASLSFVSYNEENEPVECLPDEWLADERILFEIESGFAPVLEGF